MNIVVSVNVLPNYISDLLFVVSCPLQFSLLCRLFSVAHEHALQEYCRAYQMLFNNTHRHKTIKNRHNKFFIMLKRNSFKTSLQIWRLSKLRPRVVLNIERMQFVLKNCETDCQLSAVCIIKTADHSTLSPRM